MVGRLAAAFAKPHPSLVCFIDALVSGGAEVSELGMPFTGPMADAIARESGNSLC